MNIINAAKEINEKAIEKAKEKCPELELNEIIDQITKVVKKEKDLDDVVDYFSEKYKEPREVYHKALKNFLVQEGIKLVPDDAIKELVDEEFADKIMDISKLLSKTFKEYSDEKISVSDLIDQLGEPLKDIGFDILGAHGYDKKALKDLNEAVLQSNWLMVSEIAFGEVYKILKQAEEDAQLAHEHRILIEQECIKSIALMKQYRDDLNNHVNKYLSERMETFEKGFKVMDKAIIENDVNGYISGNVEIQKILGYNVQFTNEDEFEDLMKSDIAFKL